MTRAISGTKRQGIWANRQQLLDLVVDPLEQKIRFTEQKSSKGVENGKIGPCKASTERKYWNASYIYVILVATSSSQLRRTSALYLSPRLSQRAY